MLGLMAYIVDHFAAERADIYYKHITSQLNIKENIEPNEHVNPWIVFYLLNIVFS